MESTKGRPSRMTGGRAASETGCFNRGARAIAGLRKNLSGEGVAARRAGASFFATFFPRWKKVDLNASDAQSEKFIQHTLAEQLNNGGD